ncbi:putative uncharacterized protein DDB_G0271982 [Diachasma alloeum]|uniref:putative uncharacterized protein DDB_G0271982 n=1 Tax=Diachasma alloeum TaxID=454923 RepID=UPI000738123F|nr:putative uncharacterized protein DDB_G0271982 [Diachasma alloeum]
MRKGYSQDLPREVIPDGSLEDAILNFEDIHVFTDVSTVHAASTGNEGEKKRQRKSLLTGRSKDTEQAENVSRVSRHSPEGTAGTGLREKTSEEGGVTDGFEDVESAAADSEGETGSMTGPEERRDTGSPTAAARSMAEGEEERERRKEKEKAKEKEQEREKEEKKKEKEKEKEQEKEKEREKEQEEKEKEIEKEQKEKEKEKEIEKERERRKEKEREEEKKKEKEKEKEIEKEKEEKEGEREREKEQEKEKEKEKEIEKELEREREKEKEKEKKQERDKEEEKEKEQEKEKEKEKEKDIDMRVPYFFPLTNEMAPTNRNGRGNADVSIVKSGDKFRALYFTTPDMKQSLAAWSEIVAIDGTYSLLDSDLTVMLMLVEDSNGASEIVAVCLLAAEDAPTVDWFLETFKNNNPEACANIKCFMSDKDHVGRPSLKKTFYNPETQ